MTPCQFTRQNIDYEPIPLPDRASFTDAETLSESRAFFDKMKRRHTVRDFSDRPVSRDVIEECVRVAGAAPSGANHQPWHFVGVAAPKFKHRIRLAAEDAKIKKQLDEILTEAG